MNVFSISLLLLFCLESYGVPTHISFQGRFFDDEGEPLVQENIAVSLEVRDPSGECLLYKEDHIINTFNTDGFFSVMLGSGSVHTDSPAFGLSNSLANNQVLADAKLNCAGNSYSPSAADHRMLRVFVDGQVLTPDQSLNSVPYAIQAANSAYLNGKDENDFIRDDGSNVTQSNIQNFYDSAAGLANNQSLRWNSAGSTWEVFTPGAAEAGVNSVTAGAAISVTGTVNDPIIAVDETAIDYSNLSNLPDLAGDGTSSIHFNNLTNLPAGLADGDDNTTYTDAQMLAGVSNVDGSGSGLDSDLLDGQEGAHYLAWANLTGIPGFLSDNDVDWADIQSIPADIADGDANTTYSNATGGAAGLMSSSDKTKLDGLDGFSLNAADGLPADALYVDNAGNVGIGTATPSHLVTVAGGAIAMDNNTGLVLKTSSGNQRLFFNVDASDHLNIGNTGAGDGNDSMGFDVTGINDAMYIDSTGKVGIGTTALSAKLQVGGAGSINLSGHSTQPAFLQMGHGRTNNGNAYIDMVGDTTYTDFGFRLRRWDTGPNSDSEIAHRGTGALKLVANDGGSVTLGTNSTTRLVVNSAGSVGVGTTTPGYPLEVNGVIHSSTGGFRLPDGTVLDEASDVNSAGAEVSFSLSNSGTKAIGSGWTFVNHLTTEDFDYGGNASGSTFTVPVNGRYMVTGMAHHQSGACPSCATSVQIMINDVGSGCMDSNPVHTQGWGAVATSCVLELTAGDTIRLYVDRGISTSLTIHTAKLTGFLVK